MTNFQGIADQKIDHIVLDTHTLIWYLEGIKLSENHIKLIETYRKSNKLFLSAISVWEIAQLNVKKKIAFSIPIDEWVHRLLAVPGLNIIELSINILVESCNLPDWSHKDPADRMIVAATREIDGHLLTFDKSILEYAEKGYLKIC